jgi:chlorobactene glucosyltransferase
VSTPFVVGLASLPWIVIPVVILWQLSKSKSLDEYTAEPPPNPPLVSVIVPARDEARNIEACVRSILSSTWPAFEVIVVNDHSTDGTGDIARAIAATDGRVRVVENPDLPDGWFGKQWACHNGALAARGTILLFTDADTRHTPKLLTLAVNAMRVRGADLFSVAGSLTMESFWERLLQPHVMSLIIARYGSTERLSRSKDPYLKIANGQYILATRSAYDKTGGHEAVRSHVAEDLRLAQEWCREGYSVQMVTGFDWLSTRMYHGFGEIARGWGKNVWAAGRDTLPVGRAGRAALRLVAPLPTLWEIVPAAVAIAALFGLVSPAAGVWGAICYSVTALYWAAVHFIMKAPVPLALLHPVAAVALFGIFTRAAWRGERVEWKGREYISR